MQPAILIVDDDASVRRLLQVELESLGMRCFAAGDGEEARRLLGECRPDVAIVDINLPGMDGFELLRLIRAQAPGYRTDGCSAGAGLPGGWAQRSVVFGAPTMG